MKHWYCSRVNIKKYEPGSLYDVCQECQYIEKDGYKFEQIVLDSDQNQIFYSKVEDDE